METEKEHDPHSFTVYNRVKKKSDITTLFIFVCCLAVVLVLLLQFRMTRSVSRLTPALPAGQSLGFIDSLYFNKPFFFSLKLPHAGWSVQMTNTDTSFTDADSAGLLWDQIRWLVRLDPVTNAGVTYARAGVLKWPGMMDDKNMAITLLAELLRACEHNHGQARLIVPVTQPAHRLMQGAYFMVLFPDAEPVVQVVSVLSRRHLAYIIECRTTESQYPGYRVDFEKIVAGFQSIPKKRE
jgi:hypothetical protein